MKQERGGRSPNTPQTPPATLKGKRLRLCTSSDKFERRGEEATPELIEIPKRRRTVGLAVACSKQLGPAVDVDVAKIPLVASAAPLTALEEEGGHPAPRSLSHLFAEASRGAQDEDRSHP